MARVRHIVYGLLFAVLFLWLILCCPWWSKPLQVSGTWTSATPDADQYAKIIPLPAGRALASTRKGAVYAIDHSGMHRLLVAGVDTPPIPYVIFNSSGDTFGVFTTDRFTVYDAAGNQLGELPFAAGVYKFIPSSQHIYAPQIQEMGPEDRQVTGVRILNRDGTVLASWPVTGLEISRLTPTHLIYATAEELVKATLAGTELWRTPVRVRMLQVSADGSRSIVNPATDSNSIQLYAESTVIGSDTFDSPVWNLAISPDGRFAAATSQTELRVYVDGTHEASVMLPLAFAISVDINNSGEVVVGGQTTDHNTRVQLYNHGGSMLWQESAAADNNAWRPEVRFTADGDHWVTRYQDKLVSYTIERSP